MSDSPAETGRRDRLQTIGHYLTAFVLALEGVAHVEQSPVPWGFVTLCWVSAFAIIVVTSRHHQLQPRFPALQSVSYLAEGAVCSALVVLTHHEGKVGLPFAWLVAAGFLIANAVSEFRRATRVPPAVVPELRPDESDNNA